MKTLVVVSRAHADTAFELAWEMHRDGSEIAILFTGRGTHHISDTETINGLSYADLYTVADEFDSPMEHVEAISYDRFVELLEESERTFSWI